jgi:hypothetical protein
MLRVLGHTLIVAAPAEFVHASAAVEPSSSGSASPVRPPTGPGPFCPLRDLFFRCLHPRHRSAAPHPPPGWSSSPAGQGPVRIGNEVGGRPEGSANRPGLPAPADCVRCTN